MAGTGGRLGRIVAMAIALAIGLLALAAREARAGTYTVLQCGWYVGADATWGDTTAGQKFVPDGYCIPPGADAFGPAHLKSVSRGDQATVSGSRYAAWRWTAAPGTGIVGVTAVWWHTLHDGMQQQLGTDAGNGAFSIFDIAGATETTPQPLSVTFAWPQLSFEDRLVCARPESSACSLSPGSWSATRALSLRIEDLFNPEVGLGGELVAGGWRRGPQNAVFWSRDYGSGVRFGELQLDGGRVGSSGFPCAAIEIAGFIDATRMMPCPPEVATTMPVATTNFSDGPHTVRNCVADFAGDGACTPAQTILIDNNPPAHPRPVTVAGGEGWHRVDDFDLTWTDPDQAPASPIAGANWRITGPGGYDSGVHYVAGAGIKSLADLKVPADGEFDLHLWLRDEAGNEAPATAVEIPLRFDDGAPSVAFAPGEEDAAPDPISAVVADPLAGPAGGTIAYRKPGGEDWIELATKLVADGPGRGTLTAPTPELGAPGLYLFRVEALDGAGNAATSTLRADGTRMAIRVAAGAGDGGSGGGRGGGGGKGGQGAGPGAAGARIRLFARLRAGHGSGKGKGHSVRASGRDGSLSVPFGTPAAVAGRLVSRAGVGLGGRRVRIVARPSHGALAPTTHEVVRTGKRGGFELALAPGTSRRVDVYFAGGGGLAAARRTGLDLRVRSGVSLEADHTRLRTGEVVHLSGRVAGRGAPMPRRGKLVAIQYLEAATHRWRPVLVVRSDHSGRFHARYRFRYVSGAAQIQLRATALAEERWPYAPGSSHPVTVDVHGR